MKGWTILHGESNKTGTAASKTRTDYYFSVVALCEREQKNQSVVPTNVNIKESVAVEQEYQMLEDSKNQRKRIADCTGRLCS